MSQNASLRSSKGLAKGPSTKTQQSTNAETSLKSKNNKQHNSNENHNTTKHNLEQKETGNSSIKPTADQLRIAHLIGNNKSDDPEINKKIKQVQDVVPSKLPDEILMALHENDYDIARTIDYILEGGGDLSQDWKTAGIKIKKTTSPNQTLDEQADDLVQVTQQNSTRNNNKQQNKNNESNNNNVRSRERNRERNPVKQPTKYNNNKNNKTNDINGASVPRSLERDDTNIDDKFNSMDINKENGDFNSNEYHRNNKRVNNMNYTNNGPSRGTNGTNSYRGGRNGNAVTGRGGNRNTNNFRPNLNRNQRKDDMEIVENIPLQDDKTESVLSEPITEFDPNVEVVKLNEQTEQIEPLQTGRPTKDDNLRDIGTWSNEQADKNSSNRSSSSHKPAHFNQQQQPAPNNRRFNPKTGAVNMKQNDDWENEEEWQGDLTQTQIFTASTQKKENENEYPQRTNSEQQRQFDADFPIGHFNAEEAAQKIKNAVGIGSAIASTVSANKKTNVNNLLDESKDTKTKQQQPANFKVANKFGSVKPPPPSTRIPKSAVVMPDGGNNNGFSLDVQFGVDLDTPLVETKEPEPVQQQPAVKIVTEPVGKKLNMVSPHMQQQIQKPIQQTVNKPVTVTNTAVSSVSSLGTFNSNNNEKVANVGVVNPVQANSGAKLLNSDNSLIGVSNANKLDQNLALTPVSVPLQQPLLTHNMDNMKKINQETFIDKQKHQQNYQFQQQMNHLNIQKQQMPQKQQQQHQYINQNDSNNLNQNMIQQQQRENNHHHQNNTNLNSHHYQQQQHQQQQHHHHQQSNSNLNMTNPAMKDSTSSHNLSQAASSGNNSQLLNISPQNIANKNINQSNQLNQQQQQLMNHQNNTPNPLNQGLNSNSMNNVANAGVAATAVNAKQTMPPPPGVNLVNPNSQFLMSLPFVCYDQQNFPYFDASQLDGNSIMQMYNHLGLNVPPGVGSAAPTPVSAGGATPGGPPYSTDSKFGRSEATSSNSQLNAAAAAAAAQLSQQQQQQQQQPINLIPGLSNFPFFFPNYYPNMFMSVPNGPQANPQFQNKPPYNFNNNAAYDDQNKEYTNYNPQAQIKPTGSNLNNVPDINNVGYQKNIDKSNTGYHTPPPNYSNSLMNQQQHPNVSGSSGAPPPPPQPAQYAYITSMIGTPGGNPLVHTGLQQDNMNTRSIGNTVANSIKPLQKNNYQNSPWN